MPSSRGPVSISAKGRPALLCEVAPNQWCIARNLNHEMAMGLPSLDSSLRSHVLTVCRLRPPFQSPALEPEFVHLKILINEPE